MRANKRNRSVILLSMMEGFSLEVQREGRYRFVWAVRRDG